MSELQAQDITNASFTNTSSSEQSIRERVKSWGSHTNLGKIATCVLVVLMIVLVTLCIIQCLWPDSNISCRTNLMNMNHSSCKRGEGCSMDCPYLKKDDPRAIVAHLHQFAAQQVKEIHQLFGEDYEETKQLVEELSKNPKKAAAFKTKVQIEEATKLKSKVSSQMDQILQTIQLLKESISKEHKINNKIMNVHLRVKGLIDSLLIHKYVFISLLLHVSSNVIFAHVSTLDSDKKNKIHNFDKKETSLIMSNATCNERVGQLLPFVDSDSFRVAFATLNSNNLTSERYIQGVVAMQNAKLNVKSIFLDLVNHYKQAEQFMEEINKESFNNKLPAEVKRDQINDMISKGDYSSALVNMALEPEVVSNHKKFAEERSSFDSGGGVPAVRDDDNDLVKWVGLFGRPKYQNTDGSFVAQDDPHPLRSIPSDKPEDLVRHGPKLQYTLN